MASTNDIKNGTVLDLDGQLWQVLWFQHHKPGKGNTVIRTKIQNVLSGKIVERTFPADSKIDITQVDRREMQYLYQDTAGYVFMDNSTYDQFTLPEEIIGDKKYYMLENMTVQMAIHQGNPLYIELPPSIEVEVTYTEPGLQGDRSSAGTKPATVETGLEVQVPLFITTGERIKINTEGNYLGRANN